MKRSILIALLISVILATSALVGNLQFATVKGETQVSGILSSDTTWTKANSPYTLTGNFLVSNGVTLAIQPGVSVDLNSYYIMVNGTLDARGTSADQISISGGELTFTQFSTEWNESTGSGCRIENALIAVPSLSPVNSIKISNCTLNAQVSVDHSSTVTNSIITQEINVNGYSMLSNSEVKAAVVVSGFSVVSSNTITGGVRANGLSVVTNNIIKNSIPNGGTGLTCTSNASASHNIISGWDSGITIDSLFFVDGGYPVVEDNLILNNTIGIAVYVFRRGWVGTNIPTIQNNAIYNNSKGIKFSISLQESYSGFPPTIIQNNTISQNDIGIELGGELYNSYCTVQHNNIQNNANYSLYLTASTDYNATHNWWGTTDTAAIEQSIYDYDNDFTLGRVTFIPVLAELNSAAPEIPPEPTLPPSPSASPSPSNSPTETPSPNPTDTETPTPTPSIPEFPVLLAPALFMAAAVIAALVYKKKQLKPLRY